MSLKRKVFLRSMMIQTGWNFERMQNIGFTFALYPALKKIWTTPQTFKQALERHMTPFNTQPYMSSFVLGMAWRLEERIAAKAASQQLSEAALPRDNARSQSSQGAVPPNPPSDLPGRGSAEERRMCVIKKTASSALAAIGDTLFWGTLRPATLGICLIIWIVFGFHEWMIPISEKGIIGTLPIPGSVILAGLLAGLIVYNSFAVWVRWRGLDLGYECGQKNLINCGLDAINWQKIIKILKIFCFTSAVAIVILLAKNVPSLATPLIIFVYTWIMKKFEFTNVSACGIIFLTLVVFLYLVKTGT